MYAVLSNLSGGLTAPNQQLRLRAADESKLR
jgi:hypothetical protein